MNKFGNKIMLMVRRSRAFWLTGEVEPSFIIGDGPRSLAVMAAVEWWDETFWLAYRDFRMELRAIAVDAYYQSGFDEILFWSDRSAVEDQPPGTCLVPVDEDDWLSPSLITELREACSVFDRDIFTWSVVRKAADGTARLDPNTFIESCGYAVRLPFDWTAIQNHMYLRPPREKTLLTTLAVRNETPASMSFLYRHPYDTVMETIRRSISASCENIPSIFHDTWSRYKQLLDRLLASRVKS